MTDAQDSHSRWWVYMLRCADHSLYTGICTDLQRRLDEHNGAGDKSAKYLRGRLPVRLVYWEAAADRSAASRREIALKRLPKRAKEALLNGIDQCNRVPEKYEGPSVSLDSSPKRS